MEGIVLKDRRVVFSDLDDEEDIEIDTDVKNVNQEQKENAEH